MKTHRNLIKCPECDTIQNATVEHTSPFCTYIHICEKCETILMESDWDEVKSEVCLDCNGEANFFVSNCCGASPKSNGDCDTSDYGICPDCLEHCTYGVDCEKCKGSGFTK